MNVSWTHRVWVVIAAAFLLGSCSGGIGGSGVTDDSGGTGGSGISFGVIDGFGSILVNGVWFDTNDATVVIEGAEEPIKGDLSALGAPKVPGDPGDPGRVVRVEGTIDGNGTTGTATRVVYNDNVKGPITNVTPKGPNTIEAVVLGQTVIVDDSTRLQPATITIGDLTKDNLIEVSGLADTMGVIRATHVKKNEDFVPGDNVDVKGTIENLTGDSFTINALTVNYDNSTDMSELPGGLAEGLFVEVKGTTVDGSLLTATKIELEDEIGTENADEAEVEGFVTDFMSYVAFTVGNQLIVTNTNTQFKGGVPDDIELGIKLEVEGILVSGILVAEEISFRESVELEANVDVVNITAGTLTLIGLPEIIVTINEFTEIDATPANTLDGIESGEHIRIRGRESTRTVLATRLKEKPGDASKIVLQGPVESAADPIVTILGETVDTTGFDFTQFLGADETPIGRDMFFNIVRRDDIVKLQGKLSSGTVRWEGVELEDDD